MDLPNRKLPRLTNFDYSKPNYYYVTVCTANKEELFGMPDCPTMLGIIAAEQLKILGEMFEGVHTDRFVVMPNHIHAVIVIGHDGKSNQTRKLPSLSAVMSQYKMRVTKAARKLYPNLKVWQTSFYDTIIRNRDAYINISRYIEENLSKWNSNEGFDY